MIPFLMMLAACSGGEDSDKTGDPITTANTEGCPNEAAPVVTDFTITEGDVITNEDGDEQPSIAIYVEFEDDDADLNTVSLELWVDESADGTVDTSGSPMIESGDIQVDEGACDVNGAGITLQQGIVGDPLAYETTYEFAVIAYDSHGVGSEAAITTGTTPAAL